MEDLLPIGEFSDRSGLSARVLRGYAAAGLLVPAAVDAWSGYRYYAPAETLGRLGQVVLRAVALGQHGLLQQPHDAPTLASLGDRH